MVDSGDHAWVLTSTALVLFMTLPGLALFYGGLVQSKNILSLLMQCAGADASMAMLVTHLSAATASLVWLVIEY